MTVTYATPDEVQPTEQDINRLIQKRQPGVLRSLPSDLAPLDAWKDLSHLRRIAGDVVVKVEPIDKARRQYGSGAERKEMRFGDFISKLESGKNLYLTTQYDDEADDLEAEDEDDVDVKSCFPGAVRQLLRHTDIPLTPSITAGLALASMNLWLGQSKEGASSGLHHDFHDNLYVLLKGRKRFVLYPPSRARYLQPHGTLEKVHKNGLIVYDGMPSPIRADGLSELDALKYAVKAIEREKEVELDKKKRRILEKEYEQAVEAMMEAAMDEMGEEGWDVDEEDGEQPKKRVKVEDPETTEPDSFSRISATHLHAHLGLVSTSDSVPARTRKALEKAGRPLIVNLEAGDALYLPASWWHEVTSFGTESGDNVHMAFNYWFHPPDKLKGSDEGDAGMYKDQRVWRYVQDKVRSEFETIRGTT